MKNLIFCTLFFCSSCATVLTGFKQKVKIETVPDQVQVMHRGKPLGLTPMVAKIDRKIKGVELTLVKSGYHTEKIRTVNKLAPASFFNLFGLAGYVVDLLTGSIVKYGKFGPVIMKTKSD